MRNLLLALAASVSFLSNAVAADPVVFHTAHFQDDIVISLGVVSNHAAERLGYDFDVTISLSQKHAASDDIYRDPARHKALVKCGDPAKVYVRGIDYPIPTSGAVNGADWKDDLWRAVCTPPVS
ncbi:hypothetical protein BLJAPNOD_05280 [Ensifer sp. M14]|nr:hypothetical protein BLJAPNOD_05280 [Ensifer sp. M14]